MICRKSEKSSSLYANNSVIEGTQKSEKNMDSLYLSLTCDVKVKDFPQFFTAIDRIPAMGFTKSTEVFFTHENKYPKSSTCGLTLTLPYNVTADMLIYSVKNGGTFGDHYFL